MFKEIHKKALSMGIQQHQLSRLQFTQRVRQPRPRRLLLSCLYDCLMVVAVLAACLLSWQLDWPVSRRHWTHAIMLMQGQDLSQSTWHPCLLTKTRPTVPIFRPVVQCDFCQNVSQIVRLPHISAAEFEDKYAYSGHPLIVSDGAANWSAVDVFSFEFFRDIYEPGSPVLESNCQFFAYGFSHVRGVNDVFTFYESGQHFQNGSQPVYIGWENCDIAAATKLRSHYSRPYFLPPLSQSSLSDWIFMGIPGYGASLHIDNVGLPSWQAQISGHKQWTLESPTECILQCPARLTATVHPGEIIVLDTNRWFHSTLIVGEEISITIGAEYD
ncbi:unnamed protein product [Candidula unifasciata]|uniref:JmjC domain-containing protein n=1 Tax=Candidula unifasciata TaxID=100452 RepID=A0A8S3Z9D0_9EUPU|nr:unnamed protein product [Candidula unifasciata]